MASPFRVNIFGMGKDDWNCARNVNKGIEEILLKIFKRLSLSDQTISIASEPAVSLDHVHWTSEGPRMLLKVFESHRDKRDLMRYFKRDSVRTYVSSLNYEVCSDESLLLDLDYRLRNCVDLLLHIRSHATSTVDESSETAPSATSLESPRPETQNADSYNSDFQAYNSPFSIRLIPPDRRTRYNSSNAPSFSEMFLALCNGVNETLRTIASGGGIDVSVVESCCSHIDLLLGRNGAGAEFVLDILDDYSSLGYLTLNESGRHSPGALLDMFGYVSKIDTFRLVSHGKSRSDLGFSFAPCGFLIPYHLGVTSLLNELNVINVTTPLGGGSAGALNVVCATCVRPDIRELMEITEALSEEGVSKGTRYRLDDSLKRTLKREIKPGTYMAVNKRIGEITIALLASRCLMSYKGHFVSQFTDDSDLCDGIRASCNIPGFSTTGDVIFRDEKCYDGYFAAKLRELGCHDTSANRTVRVIPFILGRLFLRRQRLKNEYMCPLLVEKDAYVVHYLRLKSLIRELWKRKFDYERLGDLLAWRSELSLIMDAYELLTSGKAVSNNSTWSDLMSIWRSKNPEDRSQEGKSADHDILAGASNNGTEDVPDLARLFILVIASEIAHKLGPDSSLSGRNYRGKLQDVDLLEKFGRSGFSPLLSRVNFKTTPYCLIDWLRYEYEITSPNGERSASYSFVQDAELYTLKGLLHAITPPMSLSYYYTEFPYLLSSSVGNMRRLTTAVSSCGKADIRYLFDVGRCDAFRWLIGEYISFENWLHLRIRQLEESERSVPPAGPAFGRDGGDKDLSNKPLHARQHELLSDLLGFMDSHTLSKLCAYTDVDRGSSSHLRLLTVQNLLVRRALMLGAVDPHYMHILCHSHLWM